MPITRGSGNPVWTWDETVLALDLLYRHGRPIDKAHADIIELSELLRRANYYPLERQKDNFRNPDGVAFKLQNLFSVLNPERKLEFSENDKAVVGAFPQAKRNDLATLATAIRAALEDSAGIDVPELNPEETFIEGRVLTARHRSRDKRLRVRLLAAYKRKDLKCTVCGLHSPSLPRDLQESLFEAHHIVPLSEAEGARTTKVRDAALICACCHRFVHRLIVRQGRWITMEEASEHRLSLGQVTL